MWIEFLGGVGSGKSSLATAFKERFNTAQLTVSTPQQALELLLARSLPKVLLHGRPGQAVKRAFLAGCQARFAFRHSKLVWQARKASRKLRHLPGWHRKLVFSLFFEVAGWYEALADSVPPEDLVVVDEGLAHRSVNLFAWQTRDLDIKAIQEYVEHLPEISLIVLVSAPVQVSLDRAHRRGLPLRLRGKDPQTVRRFVENSHTVAALVGQLLTAKGSAVIKIENNAGLEQSVAALYRQIAETSLFEKDLSGQHQTAFS